MVILLLNVVVSRIYILQFIVFYPKYFSHFFREYWVEFFAPPPFPPNIQFLAKAKIIWMSSTHSSGVKPFCWLIFSPALRYSFSFFKESLSSTCCTKERKEGSKITIHILLTNLFLLIGWCYYQIYHKRGGAIVQKGCAYLFLLFLLSHSNEAIHTLFGKRKKKKKANYK